MMSYQKSGNVKLRFVIPEECSNENDVNDEMKMAFQECLEADLSPEWIKEDQCLGVPHSKMDIFILQEFSGNTFKKLRSTKSVRVCGPICIRTCLVEGTTIPENSSPVFTTAMRDLSITASNTSPQKKMKIKEKVGFMGGIYTSNLVEVTTHVVTNAVRSTKYEKATEKGLPVMTEDWIDAVWEASLKQNIKATHPQFDKYKCKIFQDLQVTSSNLDRAEKEIVKKLITENGGIFSPQLHQNATALLIVNKPVGDKYTHAKSWKLPCVYPSWVKESIEKGYAVPTEKHLISSEMKSSTPTKSDIQNCTLGVTEQISLISHETDRTHVNETALTNTTVFSGKQSMMLQAPPPNSGSKYKEVLESISVPAAKRAGLFVDGCKVYLSGFSTQEVEGLRRLLSLGGATIFNELSETVSYVIVGDHVTSDVKAITNMARRPYVVSLEWLAASIKQKGPASGDLYSCMNQMNIPAEPPSPLSQKGLQLLQPVDMKSKRDTSISKSSIETPQPAVNRKLFKDFVKPAEVSSRSQRENLTNNSFTQSQSEIIEFFKDLTFKIEIDSDELTKEVEQKIIECGGTVVGASFKGIPDFAIVPVDREVLHITASEIVTYLWVEDCFDKNEYVSIEYYHQPFTVHPDKKPLTGYCIVTSMYSGSEKNFIIFLGEALGAKWQDVFARKTNKSKGIIGSTHLLIPTASGSKYEASVKWKIPAVTKDWLLACARTGTKVAEEPYYVANQNKNSSEEKESSRSHTSKEDIVAPSASKSNQTSLKKETVATPIHNELLKATTEIPINNQSPINYPSSSVKKKSSGCHIEESFKVLTPAVEQLKPSTPKVNASMATPDYLNKIADLENSFKTPSFKTTPRYLNLNRSSLTSSSCKRKTCTPDLDSDVSPFHIDTPNTPYGQVFGETPSRSQKKRWKKYIDNLPQFEGVESPSAKPRRDSTPMSELRAQLWKQFLDVDINEETGASNTGLNMRMRSPQTSFGKENCDPVPDNSHLAKTRESEVSPPKIQKVQTSTNEEQPSPSTSSKDIVTMHLEKLGAQLASHTPPEPKLKRHPDLLHVPANTPSSHLSCKPMSKQGLIDSQPITIGWEDPVEAAEKSKLSKRKTEKEAAKMRKFVFGSELENPEMYVEIVEKLGGEVISSSTFHTATTHVIVEKIVRSEKMLCSLAAGKWILHNSYLVECNRQEKWLPEEDYEYGNPRSVKNISNHKDIQLNDLHKAAYRLRSRLIDGNGAYSGMKVALVNIARNKGSFERLIAAGGGTIVDESGVTEATICCADAWSGSMPEAIKECVKHKIPCVKPVFLGELLYKHPTPPVKDYILPELNGFYSDKDFNQ